MSALYYCYACGMRLNPKEVETAVARGEAHATACCEKCAKAGKRVKDPRLVDSPGSDVPQHSAKNPMPNDSSLLEASLPPVRAVPPKASSQRMERGTPAAGKPDSAMRATPGEGRQLSRVVRNSPASGARIEGIRARASTPAQVRQETSQSARVVRKISAASSAERPERKGAPAKNAGLPLAAVLGGAGAVIFLIGMVVATRGGDRPREAESRITTNPVENDTQNKPQELKPPPVLSGADERRLADFERGMPTTLGAAPRSTIFFGPSGTMSPVSFKEGSETQRKAEGKIFYLDGTRKVQLQLGNAGGTVSREAIVIEYSATMEIDVNVSLEIADFGSRSGTVRFPSGSMQKIEIVPEDEKVFSRGKPGKPSGKNITALAIEPRGVQPGAFGIFRISR